MATLNKEDNDIYNNNNNNRTNTSRKSHPLMITP